MIPRAEQTKSNEPLIVNREKRRNDINLLRKNSRQTSIQSKRFRLEKPLQAEHYDQEKVKMMTKNILRKGKDTQNHLKYLRNAFAESCQNIDAFLEVDNALYTLVGYLTGNNTTLQLEAVWCLTNITANENQNIETFVKATSAYLITFLKSGSVLLQDQSAWALGNMAADSHNIREILKAQGIVKPLTELVESDVGEVVKSSLFAICNLCKSLQSFVPLVFTPRFIKIIFKLLNCADTNIFIVGDIAWLLVHFSWNKSGCNLSMEYDFINVLMKRVKLLSPGTQEYLFVVLPSLRVIGNVIGNQEDVNNLQLDPSLFDDIVQTANTILLRFRAKEYVIKECLWMVSNLFSCPMEDHLSNEVVLRDVQKVVFNIVSNFKSSNRDIQKEAAVCFCNLSHQPLMQHFKDILTSEDIVLIFMDFLRMDDLDLIWISLSYFDLLLNEDKMKIIFQKHNGLSYLEAFQHHPNENIRSKSFQVLQTFGTAHPS
ncbi:uncharacterized protein [Clytia hemisphaerica]